MEIMIYSISLTKAIYQEVSKSKAIINRCFRYHLNIHSDFEFFRKIEFMFKLMTVYRAKTRSTLCNQLIFK